MISQLLRACAFRMILRKHIAVFPGGFCLRDSVLDHTHQVGGAMQFGRMEAYAYAGRQPEFGAVQRE